MYVTYVAYHGLVEGYNTDTFNRSYELGKTPFSGYQRIMYERGQTHLSEDGKTVTATYEVDSFSPFIVDAFIEADEPEIKEFVTQPDGTLVRVINGQPVTTHTVAPGENLTVIARKYGCTVDEIVALNSELIEDPSLIRTGWVLTAPVK